MGFLDEAFGALQDNFLGIGNIKRANRELDIKEKELDIRNQERRSLQSTRDREFYQKLTDQLTEAMLEPDAAIRQTAVDALLQGAEAIRGKPISKQFKSWIVKQPEQALSVLNNIQERGVDPRVFLQVGDDPMLFAHGLLALGRANRERQARGLRGDGGGDAQPSDAPAQTPGGSGLSLEGVKQEAPFGKQNLPVTPNTVQPTSQPMDEYSQGIQMQITALERRINGLAGMGRPEPEIAPLRQELMDLRRELRAPQSAARTEGAKIGVQPVSTDDIQRGIQAAQRSGQPDLANRFVPGMRREAYDALMQKLGTTQPVASTPNAPTATMASPTGAPGAQSPAPLGRGIGLIPTKDEEQRTEARIRRQETQLPTDMLRDPNLKGVRTFGQLESGNGQPSTAAQLARQSTLASEGAKATVMDLETAKKDGMAARTQQRYLDLLAGAAEKAGARGPWLTPMRETLNNFANILGIRDPWGQSKLQLMQAVTPKLAVLLTQQMKGQQSDREFLAALSTAPSVLNTEKGFAMLVYTAREVNKMTLAHDLAARQWAAKYGALDTPNAQGKSFQEDWDEGLINFERVNGSLQERVAAAFNMKPSQLLKDR